MYYLQHNLRLFCSYVSMCEWFDVDGWWWWVVVVVVVALALLVVVVVVGVGNFLKN